METTTELTREARDKRVAVMRDVLKQLGRKGLPLNMDRGVYLHGECDASTIKGSLQTHVDYMQKECRVCMLGAAFLSYARLYNGIPADVVHGLSHNTRIAAYGCDMRTQMTDVFDHAVLDLMESVFEKGDSSSYGSHNTEDHVEQCHLAARFGEQFDSPRDAARAIAQNIIDHDGEFILPPPA